jgi:CheY-like chemotaxis protein
MTKPFIICVIDDDSVYQFTITRTIQTHQLAKKILVFSDGEQAINFLIDNIFNSENLPDIIFLWQFLEEYVTLKPNLSKKITVFMISSSVDPTDLERAKKISEVSDYIVKPITPEALKEIILVIENQESLL